MSKISLVTGAGGFIGYAITKKLLEDPDNFVFGVDNFSRNKIDQAYKDLSNCSNFESIEIDLSDSTQTLNLPEVNQIFHLAALNGTSNFYEKPLEVIRSGTLPTLNLIERYKNSPDLRFIFSGTSESYAGAVEKFGFKVPTPENVPLVISDVSNPRWSYASSKILSEVAIASAYAQYGLSYSIVRFHNVYGPRMGYSHVIPQFFQRFMKSDFRIFGCEASRSFIHISDAVNATLMIADSNQSIQEIYHVGTEDEISIKELALLIQAKCQTRGDLICLPAPMGSVNRRCPDTSKLSGIGFLPKFSLSQGLNDFYSKEFKLNFGIE